MEHRKFNKLIAELVDELTVAQAGKLIEALRERGDGDDVHKLIEKRFADNLKCPRCGADHVQRWSKEHGLQRYNCMGCGRTFNALTNTPLARLRKKERWLTFAQSLGASHSVRKAAGLAHVNKNTSFLWRHRFLRSQNKSKDQSFVGITEIDETFLLESFKGQRDLTRPPRKRGGKAQRRGLSKEQVPILIARDRFGHHVDEVLPDRSEKTISDALKEKLSPDDVLLCMDGDKALIAFAEKQKLEYELIIASKGEHVHEKVLHTQNVNGYMSRFKQWLARFNGVATKYLPSYLGWRRELEADLMPLAAAL